MTLDVETVLRAYVECALWSSTDNADDAGGEPLDANFGPDDLADEAHRLTGAPLGCLDVFTQTEGDRDMASKGTEMVTELFQAERLNNSVNGNPRFRLVTRDGSYVTQSDAACSYDVDNVMMAARRNGGSLVVRLSLTPAGRVWGIEKVAE